MHVSWKIRDIFGKKNAENVPAYSKVNISFVVNLFLVMCVCVCIGEGIYLLIFLLAHKLPKTHKYIDLFRVSAFFLFYFLVTEKMYEL